MDFIQLLQQIAPNSKLKTFLTINFGCRVNAAETNQLSQLLINLHLKSATNNPDLVLINTCSVTAKANIESLGKIRQLRHQYPDSIILVTGCANTDNLNNLSNIFFITNPQKETLLQPLRSSYTPQIGDKFSHTHRFILKVQSGCNHFCSYCLVPSKRPTLWSLSIKDAINSVNQTVNNGYQEIIITGINLNLYQPGLSNLLKSLLQHTSIPLISFGSIPLNCIDHTFLDLYSNFNSRLSNFLHIPIQSGSDKILKLMHRPYTRKKTIAVFNKLKQISLLTNKNTSSIRKPALSFGTDIIVGFPSETDSDFRKTYNLCQSIGFAKIHVFKYSSRPGTSAAKLFQKSPKLSPPVLRYRSRLINQLQVLL